ncbi:MerR family transcriptional regulator [Paracoccus endophyticus]|jgi:DNA-binding transcriptional MerR regulator|uniref:MerR family transcriptional regulator n=1 Tax=Paracoccus endophyticus TaxID=2233774 RepID=UPI000DDA24AF|nr:MerR family DNA-binding transcriptional regulator [Paracoccus endophyticus]
MTDELLTIREMCDRYGVTPRALRFYESRELLFPERRGQHRLYDRRDRGRLVLILRGKRFGFSLEEIRHLLDLYVPGARNRDQIARTLTTARDHLAKMRAQRDELGQAITDLESHIAEAQARLDALPADDTPIR